MTKDLESIQDKAKDAASNAKEVVVSRIPSSAPEPKKYTKMAIPPGEAHAALAMAAFVGLGGVMAAYKGSMRSAIFSGLYAVGYALCGDAIQKGEGEMGHGGAAALGGFLTVSMGMRFAASRKIFPPGVIGAAALMSTGYHALKWNEWRG